jgi:hypothetical protein
MPRGNYRHREPKKTKKDKKKMAPLVEILPQISLSEPDRVLPKRKPSRREEEEEES